jgi:hypothetical protein
LVWGIVWIRYKLEKMPQLYVEYNQRRDEHEVHGVMVPHINGISWMAPDECEVLDNGCIGEMSTSHQSEESTFVSIPISKESEYLYVLVISESGGGGSYHEIDFDDAHYVKKILKVVRKT